MTNYELIEIHLNNSDLSLSNLAAISNRTEAEVLVVLKDSNYINILKGQLDDPITFCAKNGISVSYDRGPAPTGV